MISTTKLRAARKFGPGYFIREQMEIRDWVQEDLSEILGISLKHVNKILKDNQPLTIEIARLLGKIFDTSAQYWLNVDINIYSTLDNGINQFLDKLNDIGVKFFILSHLQKTYLDGAAFISSNNPVIVYTGRYKRIDNFWFTVAHEITHVLNHLNDETQFVLDNLKDNVDTEIEAYNSNLPGRPLRLNGASRPDTGLINHKTGR